MIPYEDFISELNRTIKYDAEFYRDLLEKVIDNPRRYTGIFRISNVRTKLIQNATQSREIKFGDFLENIVILAAGMELTDEDLRELRGRCVREVKETRGRISFEDAWAYQKGGRENP